MMDDAERGAYSQTLPSSASPPKDLPVLIEFPGYLRSPADPSGAITALGGLSAVGSVLASDKSDTRLRLELRHGREGTSSGIVGTRAEKTRRHFLAKVLVGPGDEPGVKVVQTVRIARIIKFPAMADFQYFDKGHAGGGGLVEFAESMARDAREEIVRKDSSPGKLPQGVNVRSGHTNVFGAAQMEVGQPEGEKDREAFVKCSDDRTTPEHETIKAAAQVELSASATEPCEMEYLRPVRFARHFKNPTPPNYWFKQFSCPEDNILRGRMLRTKDDDSRVGIDRRFGRTSYAYQFPYVVDIGTPTIPTVAPSEIKHFEEKVPKSLVEALEELFRGKPVWNRRALYHYRPKEFKTQMRYASPIVAYCFRPPSPFSHTWIRYGFDPRSDPSSRQYQTVEVRVKDPAVVAAMKRMHVKDPDEYRANFNIESLPSKRILYIQLCDLEDTEITSYWKSLPMRKEFDSKNGFFTSQEVGEIVNKIKKKLSSMAEESLGRDTSEAIRRKVDRVQALRSKKGITIAQNRRLVARKHRDPRASFQGPGLVPYVNNRTGDIDTTLDDEKAAAAAAFSFAALQQTKNGSRNAELGGDEITPRGVSSGQLGGLVRTEGRGGTKEVGLEHPRAFSDREREEDSASNSGSSFGEIEVFEDEDDDAIRSGEDSFSDEGMGAGIDNVNGDEMEAVSDENRDDDDDDDDDDGI